MILFTASFTACNEAKPIDTPSQEKEIVKVDENFKFNVKIPQENIGTRTADFFHNLIVNNTKKGPAFAISISPADKGVLLLSNIEDYYNKRYEDGKIKSEFQQVATSTAGEYQFIVGLVHISGNYDENEVINIDDKFYEFFFLENENGDFVRPLRQEKDFLTTEVNWISQSAQVLIAFPKDEVDKMMANGSQLFMTYNGLAITADNKTELQYPFTKYYAEEFPEAVTMVEEME